MIYELRIDCLFNDYDPLNDILQEIDNHKLQMTVINPHTDYQEASSLDVIENHHDENPHSDCHLVLHWDNAP